MGLLLSDLSRSFASALDLNLQPWDFNLPRFPRVVWPQDWRLPHLRGLEFMERGPRRGWGREGVGGTRRRVNVGEVRGGRPEFVDDDLEEERRARGGRGGIAKSWGWKRTKERDLPPPPPPRERRILKGEDPLNDLRRYVRKAEVDLAGFSWAPSILASSAGTALGRVRSRTSGHGEDVEEETDEEASRRRKRDEAFEVLNFSRIQPVRLKVVKRMKSGLLGREIGAYLTSQLPSTPINPPSSGHPLVFSLPSEKFFTVEWHEPSSDLNKAISYVQQTILATALSVLCVVRSEEDEEEGRARAEELGFYQAISKSSPLPTSAAKTLVLLDKANSRVRLLLLEVQTPRERVFEEFVKEELNFELTAKDQIFHREFPPHPSIAEANALQAHIFASCLENRVMNFVLTDVETWVFGNIDPATGVMHVSPVLDTSSKNPSIFECFLSLVLRSFDARPRFDAQHQPIPLPTRVSRRPSLNAQPSPSSSSSSRQPSLSSHSRSHSTPYPPSSSQHSRFRLNTPAPSRPQSNYERDLPPLPPSSSPRTRPPTPASTRPQPQRPFPRSPHPRHHDNPESYAERARPPQLPTRLAPSPSQAGPTPAPRRRVGPQEDSSDDQDRFDSRRRPSHRAIPSQPQPRSRTHRTQAREEEEEDDWDEEELAWERTRGKKYGHAHPQAQAQRKPTRDFTRSQRWEDADWDSSEEETEVRGGRGEGLRREGGWEGEDRERMRGKGYGRERDMEGSGWSGGGWGGRRMRDDGRGREGRGGRGGMFSLPGDRME